MRSGLRGCHYKRLTGIRINGPAVLVTYTENTLIILAGVRINGPVVLVTYTENTLIKLAGVRINTSINESVKPVTYPGNTMI